MENPHVLALCGPSVVGRIQCTWAQVRAHEDCGVKMAQFSAHWFSKGDRCGHSCGSRPAAIWRDKLIPCKLHGLPRTDSGHSLWHHWCESFIIYGHCSWYSRVEYLPLHVMMPWMATFLPFSMIRIILANGRFVFMLPLTMCEQLKNVFV